MAVSAVSPFVHALNTQYERLSEASKSGRRCIGYFCHYTPVELIHASGFIPVRISGGPGDVERAYGLAPDFICPFMKRSLEKALAGEFDYLSGLIQGYTCDIACGMANIWMENIPGELFHILPLPYEDTPDSQNYLIQEYHCLIEKLGAIGGAFSDTRLRESLDLYAGIRQIIHELHDLRTENQLPLTAPDLWHVVNAGFVCPPENYLEMLKGLKNSLDKMDKPDPKGIPVMVSGSLVESPEVLALVESRGGWIVADDLCTGQRALNSNVMTSGEPLQQLADLHFNRFPCPSRSRAEDRLPLLKQLISKSGARGVIFMFQKFCTPHLCDYPFLSKGLQEAGIPSVMIELEETRQSDAQIGTRLEGLFEIIEG